MNDKDLVTLEQVANFVNGSRVVDFKILAKQDCSGLITLIDNMPIKDSGVIRPLQAE